MALIPDLAPWVKDLALPQLWHRSQRQLRSGADVTVGWPAAAPQPLVLGLAYATGVALRRKKEGGKEGKKERGSFFDVNAGRRGCHCRCGWPDPSPQSVCPSPRESEVDHALPVMEP